MNPIENECYRDWALERPRQGDLFAERAYVVPVKTGGRSYGSISRAIQKAGVTIPVLPLRQSVAAIHDGKTIVFMAFWDDDNRYTDSHIALCVASAVVCASRADVATLAIPLLGDKDKMQFLGAMEYGVEQAEAELESLESSAVEVSLVSSHSIT